MLNLATSAERNGQVRMYDCVSALTVLGFLSALRCALTDCAAVVLGRHVLGDIFPLMLGVLSRPFESYFGRG